MTRAEREPGSEASQETFLPAVDALETRDELVLVADMPGVGPDGLEVTVEDGVLTLLGRVKPPQTANLETLVEEFRRGDYYRQFRLPRDFAPDKIDASLKGGVVTVRIPRQEKAKPRKIPVRTE